MTGIEVRSDELELLERLGMEDFVGAIALVPVEYCAPGIWHYVLWGREVGGFLRSLLSNDLREAIGRADDRNLSRLVEWVRWLYNEVPGGCWGSEEKYLKWCAEGGLMGKFGGGAG